MTVARSTFLTFIACLLGGPALASDEAMLLGAPVYVGAYPAPRIVIAGDFDGDGRAELLSINPAEAGAIDLVRLSPLGKPLWPQRTGLKAGAECIAACALRQGAEAALIAVIQKSGAVRLLRFSQPGEGVEAGAIPKETLPAAPLQMLVGDFESAGKPELLLAGADGRLALLRLDSERISPVAVSGKLRGARRLVAGPFGGGRVSEVAWITGGGDVLRANIELRGGKPTLGRPRLLLHASPGDGLAAGAFAGGGTDLLVGDGLLHGGDPAHIVRLSAIPAADEAAGDCGWLAADFHGTGHDDLLRIRRGADRFTGSDALIYPATAMRDSDGDGLPDAWETGEVKPAGLDLADLGCKPGRRDVIVEVQRVADVSEERVRSEMAQVVGYFAALPVENADGSRGIALHVIYREPIPVAEAGRGWQRLGARYHPGSHRGITHWMVVYNGGGGQSGEMTDRGGCGANALYATFIHEFGHQLGLPHSGFWSAGSCPSYPSLMNYTYSYQLNGRRNDIGYSDGRLTGVVLDERHLNEHFALPMDKVAFLAGPPYHFRMKPAEDGGTLIDWNWDGIFGETDVAADINYGYGTTAGLRHTIGKTYSAPAAAAFGAGRQERLLLFSTELPAGAPLPPVAANAKTPGVCRDQPGRLVARAWHGADPAHEGPKWSSPLDVEAAGVIDDPSACSLGDAVWVAYPTTAGITVRRAMVASDGKPLVGPATAIPGSAGAEITLVAIGKRLALFLWRGPDSPVALRSLQPAGEGLSLGEEVALGFKSLAPVGAAQAPDGSLWIGLSQNQDGSRTSRWQVRRFEVRPGGLKQVAQEWIGGDKGQERGSGRVMLLCERDRAYGPSGRLYLLACGLQHASAPWQCHYVTMRIADRGVNGGWLTRRYYDEWTQSRSAPAACFFRGDIFFASRWFGNVSGTENDNLFVGFYGRGIESRPMGDFDDISFIRDVGLSHSIPFVSQ